MEFVIRHDPAAFRSAVLAAMVHALLFALLFFGVRWQSRHADTVEVQLWSQLPAIPQPAPPQVEVKPEPAPAPKIESKPEPKPELKMESKLEPAPKKPDIVVAKKATPKKPVAPKERPLPKIDEQKLLREQLAREQAALKPELDKQAEIDRQKREAASAQARAVADWIGRISAKVRSNVALPTDVQGNPEAIFDLVLLPTGDVLQVSLRKSSGIKVLDDAVERAIKKSSPLPKPERAELFQRNLELKYRPLD
jgi:colicin import membrane protein